MGATMAWGAGTQVGAYEIVGTLGNGGMGEVYKVRHSISQRTEAMKVLLSGAAKRPEVTDRFVREIRVLANLNHPNIAALHTAFHHEDQLIMVMEYVEGMNLSERLARGMTLKDSVGFIRQALTALAFAHSKGVIHRDIKPSNIMIDAAGQVKLLDFGLALISSPDPRLTSSGSLIGSVHYISPEQIRGDSPDARSDLYSMGVTLFEVITGRLPIQGQSFPEIITGHLQTTAAGAVEDQSVGAGGAVADRIARAGKGSDRPLPECGGIPGSAGNRAARARHGPGDDDGNFLYDPRAPAPRGVGCEVADPEPGNVFRGAHRGRVTIRSC